MASNKPLSSKPRHRQKGDNPHDTTAHLMYECNQRGHSVFVLEPHDIYIRRMVHSFILASYVFLKAEYHEPVTDPVTLWSYFC
ncbi:MAG: hypothetical protein H8E17_19905 [Deltaproteobacteria bacterium]|nr:hypothetical protein [Deltaproteobacteria bacterium]